MKSRNATLVAAGVSVAAFVVLIAAWIVISGFRWSSPPDLVAGGDGDYTGSPSFPAIKDFSSLRIKLYRGPCFGTCPAYTVELSGDGAVTYCGAAFVTTLGEARAKVSEDSVRDLVGYFASAKFFDLRDRYAASITDMPTYVVRISFDGLEKQVIDYVGAEDGMPRVVTKLEEAIDLATGSTKWTTASDVKFDFGDDFPSSPDCLEAMEPGQVIHADPAAN